MHFLSVINILTREDEKKVIYITWYSIANNIMKQLLTTNISCDGFYFSKSFCMILLFAVSK
jgi:hypothetical protein